MPTIALTAVPTDFSNVVVTSTCPVVTPVPTCNMAAAAPSASHCHMATAAPSAAHCSMAGPTVCPTHHHGRHKDHERKKIVTIMIPTPASSPIYAPTSTPTPEAECGDVLKQHKKHNNHVGR